MANANANAIAIYRRLLARRVRVYACKKKKREEPRGAMLVHLGAAARFRSSSTFE